MIAINSTLIANVHVLISKDQSSMKPLRLRHDTDESDILQTGVHVRD